MRVRVCTHTDEYMQGPSSVSQAFVNSIFRGLITTCISFIFLGSRKAPKVASFLAGHRAFPANGDVSFQPTGTGLQPCPNFLGTAHPPALPMPEDGRRAFVQGSALILCPCYAQPRVHSQGVPAFKMLIWEQATIADTTTEAYNVGPNEDLWTGSPGRRGPPADRATWLASGHRQPGSGPSFWVMATKAGKFQYFPFQIKLDAFRQPRASANSLWAQPVTHGPFLTT